MLSNHSYIMVFMPCLFPYAFTYICKKRIRHHHHHFPNFLPLILSPNICSSQQSTTSRAQTTTEYRTSYQVTKQARNTVVDSRGGRRVESGVYSEYYPGRSRAKIVNIDDEKQGGYAGPEEPQVKVRNMWDTNL